MLKNIKKLKITVIPFLVQLCKSQSQIEVGQLLLKTDLLQAAF